MPDDVDWSFLFKIQGGYVFRVCPPSSPQLRTGRFHKNPGKPFIENSIFPSVEKYEEHVKEQMKQKIIDSQNKVKPLLLGKLKFNILSIF